MQASVSGQTVEIDWIQPDKIEYARGMVTKREIPALVKLLDDDSPSVRATVVQELSAFRLGLQEELSRLPFSVNPIQKRQVDDIVAAQKRECLRQAWPEWIGQLGRQNGSPQIYQQLESGLTLLSRFLHDWSDGEETPCGPLLDKLAEACQEAHGPVNPIRLARFLFEERGFHGNESDYYNPQNSNLAYVLQQKQGIPISLTSVYMLLGWRLGLTIEGCQFPGHFLSRFYQGRDRVFVDCFNGGVLIREADLLRHKVLKSDLIKRVVQEPATPASIVQRFLVNLIRTYEDQEDDEQGEFLKELFEQLNRLPAGPSEKTTLQKQAGKVLSPFSVGQMMTHRRYDYHGLIVNVTMECQADDTWYYRNRTQPRREQPWYHVLVHESDQVTYVAHANIKTDNSLESITHPLISTFFSHGPDGGYLRNDTPWPEN